MLLDSFESQTAFLSYDPKNRGLLMKHLFTTQSISNHMMLLDHIIVQPSPFSRVYSKLTQNKGDSDKDSGGSLRRLFGDRLVVLFLLGCPPHSSPLTHRLTFHRAVSQPFLSLSHSLSFFFTISSSLYLTHPTPLTSTPSLFLSLFLPFSIAASLSSSLQFTARNMSKLWENGRPK